MIVVAVTSLRVYVDSVKIAISLVQLNLTLRAFMVTTILVLNPNQAGGGRNQDGLCLTARHLAWHRARSVKPPCNFHFWCLELV